MLRFVKSEDGYALALTAVVLPVLLLMAALAVDAANLLMETNRAQSAADSAALTAAAAAASALDPTKSTAIGLAEGYAQASYLGYVNTPASTRPGNCANIGTQVVCIGTPAKVGGYTNAPGYWEAVILSKPPVFFGSIYNSFGLFTGPKWRAYGHAVVGASSPCVAVLDPIGPSALEIFGTGNVSADCGVYVNSSSNSGIDVQGSSASLCATFVSVVGNFATTGSQATINDPATCQSSGGYYGTIVTSQTNPAATAVADPYASLDTTTNYNPTGTTRTNFSQSCSAAPNTEIPSGIYQGDLNVCAGNSLNGGIYYVAGNVNLGGGSSLTGTGTIVLTKPGSRINATGAYTFDVSRPNGTGWNKDLVITQSAKLATGGANGNYPSTYNQGSSFGGGTGANFSLEGAIYLPAAPLTFAGSTDKGGCALFVVKDLRLQGGSTLSNSCALSSLLAGVGKGKLVE